jgi:uncharacterized protein YukE
MSWSLVGGNPTPGDPDAVTRIASDFEDVSSDAAECQRQLTRIRDDWESAIWRGDAADAFRRNIDELPNDLGKLTASYRLAGGALRRYAGDLRSAQEQARTALRKAEAADADRSRASSDKRVATNTRIQADQNLGRLQREYRSKKVLYDARRLAQLTSGHPDPSLPAAYNDLVRLYAEINRAQGEANRAAGAERGVQARIDDDEAQIRSATSLAGQARDLRRVAADRAIQGLRDAEDAGIKNRNWFQRTIDFVEKLSTGDPNAWTSLVDSLKTVANVLTVASLLLGWVPVLGQVLTIAALAVSALSLIGTLILVANGRASFLDLGIAAADVALGFVGARGAASGISKGLAEYGERGAKAVLRKGLADEAAKLALKARPYKRLMQVMKNPSAKGFRNVVIGFSSNAGIAKRLLNYDDARKATGWLHSAYAIEKSKVPAALIRKGKDALSYGQDFKEHGFDYANRNVLFHGKKRFVEHLDPSGATGDLDGLLGGPADDLFGKPDGGSTLQLPGHATITIPAKVH